MTSLLFQDFDERAKEVRKYFIFLKNLEQGSIQLSMTGMAGKNKIRKIDSELEKTLKASGFLLLYNLIESTMRNAIEAIFEEIKNKKVSFDQVRPEIKIIIIKNLKKRKPDKILEKITAISVDIIEASFDKEDLFSGNIDGRLIKQISNDYGFSCRTDSRRTGNGDDLLTVKSNRNDLAHGVKSFAEVGKEKSPDELLKISKKVIIYLKEILQNIETYLTNQDYLESNQNNS
jgi:hypothetical protein